MQLSAVVKSVMRSAGESDKVVEKGRDGHWLDSPQKGEWTGLIPHRDPRAEAVGVELSG